jgi:UDP-N-acetylmuramyl tripeptide synthase
VVAGRTAGTLSRRFHLGGGTSIVGVVAQRIYPQIIPHLATQLEHGNVIVTGTNGKTTTSSFIADIFQDGGLRVWRNREGSNLTRGIASALVIRALPTGRLRRAGRAISVFEVDEAAIPHLVNETAPRVIVFTNLFRDQLDRYGEVDSIVTRWQEAIRHLPTSTILVLNADDPTIAYLGKGFAGQVYYYGIDDPSLNLLQQENNEERHQVMDARTCLNCGSEYTYSIRFFSHMGHYLCPNCGNRRPQPDISATRILADGFDRHRLTLTDQNAQEHEITVPLPGLYNIYNALAAAAAARATGSDWQPITSGIEQFKPMFGRGERVQAEGRTLRLLLAKNPTGFNEVLRTLFSDGTPRHVLFILNDQAADGRDVSWIWDVDFERAAGYTSTLVVAGSRALDLAIRLVYAGIPEEKLQIVPPAALRAQHLTRNPREERAKRRRGKTLAQPELTKIASETRHYGLKNALNLAIQQTPEGETLFIVPTYTGLLEVHRELEQRGLTPHYWEGKDL